MRDDLLDLPFDQFQRYRLALAFADTLRPAGRPLKVLDVGGYPGLMIDFLPDDEVTVVDVIDADLPNYVRASGVKLPFEDGSFDLVCTCDALEHVPSESRSAFINELVRVSGEYLFLTAPFFDDRTRMAEEILYQYVERVLRTDFVTLREHLDNGLPDYADTVECLKAAGLRTGGFPSGYLYHWLPMMVAKHHLLAHPDTEQLHRRIDRFYNLNFSPDDFREPSYRRVIVGSKTAGPRIEDFVRPYAVASDGSSSESDDKKLEMFRLMSGLLDVGLRRDVGALMDELKGSAAGELKEAKEALAERDRRMTDLQSVVNAQNQSLDELHALVTRVRNFWPYKIYNRVKGKPE